jgi:hypothetical protein
MANDHQNVSSGEDKKTAVVVIHGMGEQKPMQTLRGFVEAVWQRDASLFAGRVQAPDYKVNDVWSKPDQISGSAELRRITTARARDAVDAAGHGRGKRADFFELHWADLTSDSNWGDFLAWFKKLLLRNPLAGGVPVRLLFIWGVLWLGVLALGVSALSTAWVSALKLLGQDPMAHQGVGKLLSWRGWAFLTAGLALGGTLIKALLTAYLGDVARYVSAAPRNIGVRREARQRGQKLLADLAASNAYDRIIVVGHSLGSVLAHDLIMLAWSSAVGSIRAAKDSRLLAALRHCEEKADELLGAAGYVTEEPNFLRDDRGSRCHYHRQANAQALPAALKAYRAAQRNLFRELAATQVPVEGTAGHAAWLISDLVTLGSPLTHAELLMADSLCDLRHTVFMREALRCPPLLEQVKRDEAKADDAAFDLRFSFQIPKRSGVWQPHHGSAMAPVRWTNIHDASKPLSFWLGDLVSGPLARDFGPGVADVQVKITRPKGLLRFLGLQRLVTHTLYWTDFLRGFDIGRSGPAGATGTTPSAPAPASASASASASAPATASTSASASLPAPQPPAPPDHVAALREALNFPDDPELEARLLARLHWAKS